MDSAVLDGSADRVPFADSDRAPLNQTATLRWEEEGWLKLLSLSCIDLSSVEMKLFLPFIPVKGSFLFPSSLGSSRECNSPESRPGDTPGGRKRSTWFAGVVG